MKVAVVGPLPPARSGPAPYLASLLPALSEHVHLTLCVPDVEAVSPELRDRWDVRGLDARFDPSHDLVVYQLANNPWHAEVLDAAMEGPPGLLVVHDASLHHLQVTRTYGAGDHAAYRTLLTQAHGDRGTRVADLAAALATGPFAFERFLFDALAPLLDRHLAAQAHSGYAAELLRRRAPGLPVHVVPLRAPDVVAAAPLHAWGIPAGRTVLGHAGFVTSPKRYDVMCGLVAALVTEGHDVHLLLAGEDGTGGDLDRTAVAAGVQDRVTCTGWQSEEDHAATVASFDIALSLRWPHVGESSAALAGLLAQGIPTVVEPVGSWAEHPATVVARADLSGGAVEGLAAAVRPLVADPDLRRAWSQRARAYAAENLSAERVASRLAEVFEATSSVAMTPRAQREALTEAVARRGVSAPRVTQLPLAPTGHCLLAVDAPAEVLADLSAHGYEVCEAPPRLMPTGSVDVVSVWGSVTPALLLQAHRVLAPGGLLHAEDVDASAYGLTRCGDGLARKTGPVLAPRPLLSA